MIDKKLFSVLEDGKKYIRLNVLWQWIALLADAAFIYAAALTLDALYSGISGGPLGIFAAMTATGAMLVKYMCIRARSRCAFLSSCIAEEDLQEKIFAGCSEDTLSAEAAAALRYTGPFAEYYSTYVPQFYYAVTAPVTLFLVLCLIDWKAALVLLVFVPVLYALVRQERKQLLLRYISLSELAAYAGMAAGMIFALLELKNHSIAIYGCLMIILLAPGFYLPMLKLKSRSGIYKEGISASERISAFLETETDGKEGACE